MIIDGIKVSKSSAANLELMSQEVFDWLIKENSPKIDPDELEKRIEYKESVYKQTESRNRAECGDERPVRLDSETKDNIKAAAVRQLSIEIIVWEIAQSYDLFWTQVELDKEYKAIAQELKLTVKQIRAYYRKEFGAKESHLKFQITRNKVIQFLLSTNRIHYV